MPEFKVAAVDLAPFTQPETVATAADQEVSCTTL